MATAVESSPKNPAEAHRATMPTKVAATMRLVARERAERGQRTLRRGRRVGRRGHFGRHDPLEHPRQQRHRGQRRDRRGDQPGPEVHGHAEAAGHLRAERVGGHGREPQRRRQAQAHHAREHQVAAQLPAVRIVRRGSARLGQTDHERVQHAPSRGVARERGRDDAIHQEDAVREAQRRPSEQAHDEMAEPLPEPALDDGPRHQEGHHDEQNRRIRETGVRLGGSQKARQHGRGGSEHGGGENRECPDDDREDRGQEQREQPPRRDRESVRRGHEPDDERRAPPLPGGRS